MNKQQTITSSYPHDLIFKTSSFTPVGKSCVGVAVADGRIIVTNTNMAHRPVVEFSAVEWRAFILGVKNGEFDLDLPI